jgi:glycosyltransferase involved in cell wall biosynthesis
LRGLDSSFQRNLLRVCAVGSSMAQFRVLMLSGDPTAFMDSPFRTRLLSYVQEVELTVVVTGVGLRKTETLQGLTLVYPGGMSRVQNFFNILSAARRLSRGVSVVTAQDPYLTGLVGVYAAWGRCPLQLQVHGPLFDAAFSTESLRHRIESLLARLVLPLATCVRVVSEKTRAAAARVTRAPITVLPIAADTAQFEKTYPRPKEYGDAPVILAASRLSKEKNIPQILGALLLVPRAHLYIAGDGAERSALDAYAAQLQLSDRVHFLGFRNPIAPYLQHASVVVHASRYESYCLTLVEAVLARTPLVTTDVGVARELPQELVTVVSRNVASIAAALQHAIDVPPDDATRDRARHTLSEKLLSSEETSRRFLASLKTCGL